MSEPFPAKADTEFFTSEEAERIQEEWEPSQGDWVISKGEYVHKRPHLVMQTGYEGGVVYLFGNMRRPRNRDTVILLPRQGQLWEILEERGWHMSLSGRQAGKDYEYYVVIYNVNNYRIDGHGPTPAIALGRALLEAIQRGKK